MTASEPNPEKRRHGYKGKKAKIKPETWYQWLKYLTKRTWFFLFQLLTGAALLGFLGWWGYTQIMKQVLGRFELFNWEKASVTFFGEPRALLVNPSQSLIYFRVDTLGYEKEWPYKPREVSWKAADTLWLAPGMKRPNVMEENPWEELTRQKQKDSPLLDYWKELLFKKNIGFKVIDDQDLIDISSEYNLIILPGNILLSAEQRRSIKDFMISGGNLLACWSPGCRDEKGEWTGFDFMSQFIGGRPSRGMVDVSGGTSVILTGNSPITASIQPGTHLELYTYNGYQTMDLVEPRTNCDGFWFSPYWENRVGGDKGKHCAIASGTYVKGRYVWFSFTPETVQANGDNVRLVKRMIDNSIAWLNGTPLVAPGVWPPGYRAGGSLLLDTRASERPLRRMMRLIDAAELPIDIIAEKDYSPQGVFEGITIRGDILLSSSKSYFLFGRSLSEQAKWIGQQSSWLKQVTGIKPVGLYPFDWVYDNATMQAAARKKLLFLLGDREPQSYGPTLHQVSPGGWWDLLRKVNFGTVPKSQLSLEEWRFSAGIKSEKGLLNAMKDDINRIRRAGGAYYGILQPEILVDENAQDLPIKLMEHMEDTGVWYTTSSKVSERYLAWSGIRVSSEYSSPTRVGINLSNEGRFQINDLVIDVYLRREIEELSISSEFVGYTPKSVIWNKKNGICTFVIPALSAGDNTAIYIDFIGQETDG